jgi:hypothetical protein
MTQADGGITNRAPEKRNKEPGTAAPSQRPRVTFRGNSYDLTALAALVIGIIVVLMCVTLGQAVYCLPVAAVALGIIGLVMARDAIDPERTRLWSWLGIGSGGLTILLAAALMLTYFLCAFFAMLLSFNRRW